MSLSLILMTDYFEMTSPSRQKGTSEWYEGLIAQYKAEDGVCARKGQTPQRYFVQYLIISRMAKFVCFGCSRSRST